MGHAMPCHVGAQGVKQSKCVGRAGDTHRLRYPLPWDVICTLGTLTRCKLSVFPERCLELEIWLVGGW